jgi:hypothetical protein
MRAYLIIDNGKSAQCNPYKEQYHVTTNPSNALARVDKSLAGSQLTMMSIRDEQQLIDLPIGMRVSVSGGDFDIHLMPIEIFS